MTAHLPVHEGALTLEQWQQVEALARTLTPEQARWISGYFAGLDAGLLRAGGGEAQPVAATQGRTLTILYGTETGNARDLAKALGAAASGRGLAPKVADLSDYKVRGLKDEQDILFIVSTYGEGDPPQPAVGFFEFLEGPRAPKLEGVRYSVLALGDSTYEFYCEAGKRIDKRMEELGAKRLSERVDCDVDYEEPADAWSQALVDLLAADVAASAAPSLAAAPRAGQATATSHDKKNPFPATVLENIQIVGRHSSKETRHVELGMRGFCAPAADGPQGLVQTGGTDPTLMSLMVVWDSGCVVQQPYPSGCHDGVTSGSNQNLTLKLPGGGALFVAGVQYAPSDNVKVAGNAAGTGIVGAIISWTLEYDSGFLNQESAATDDTGVLRLDRACSPNEACTP
jgi:flavodoxin